MSNTGVGGTAHLGRLHDAGDLHLRLDVGGGAARLAHQRAGGHPHAVELDPGVATDHVDAAERCDRDAVGGGRHEELGETGVGDAR